MSWETLSPSVRRAAEETLTPKQLNVVRDRTNGHSWRTIGDAYCIDEATARGHYKRALKRIRDIQEEQAA